MADKGYSPNPTQVKVGDKVEWTNKDSVQHTITSGAPGSADSGKEFDSGLTKLLNPGSTLTIHLLKPATFHTTVNCIQRCLDT